MEMDIFEGDGGRWLQTYVPSLVGMAVLNGQNGMLHFPSPNNRSFLGALLVANPGYTQGTATCSFKFGHPQNSDFLKYQTPFSSLTVFLQYCRYCCSQRLTQLSF
jgi:hypothetical protein